MHKCKYKILNFVLIYTIHIKYYITSFCKTNLKNSKNKKPLFQLLSVACLKWNIFLGALYTLQNI